MVIEMDVSFDVSLQKLYGFKIDNNEIKTVNLMVVGKEVV